uniref:CHHC U11-48K-type domain-containing protein n=1 Tax=Glossina austeni TaxID=7395 RepID=A0A1A9VLE9_GLOAU
MMFAPGDEDDMVECPYDKAHRMLRKRLAKHLIKCRVNHPDAELQKCPFNNTHLVPEPEFVNHVTNCPDRKLISNYKCVPVPKLEERPQHKPVETDENWDNMEAADYDPKKYLENVPVLRRPDGTCPSERKDFIKKERKRLGYDDSDTDSDRPSSSRKFSRRENTDERECTPTKNLENVRVSQRSDGAGLSERKEFIKKEPKRSGYDDNDTGSDHSRHSRRLTENDEREDTPTNYLENVPVLRRQGGKCPSERREFIKNERKRSGYNDSDTDSDPSSYSHKLYKQEENGGWSERERTPPPPPIISNWPGSNWSETASTSSATSFAVSQGFSPSCIEQTSPSTKSYGERAPLPRKNNDARCKRRKGSYHEQRDLLDLPISRSRHSNGTYCAEPDVDSSD